jgi:hypothetical protein
MTQRPNDVPAAVRNAFSRHRVRAAWEMMARSEGTLRTAALDGFERLLVAEGLTLLDLSETIMSIPSGSAPTDAEPRAMSPFEQAFAGPGGFGGIFGEMNARRAADRAAAAPTPPQERRRRRRNVQGRDVPAQVHGRIRIEDERKVKGSDMLVFEVICEMGDETIVYGPLTSFSKTSIEKLRKAADREDPKLVAMKLRAPATEGRMPQTEAVWFC